MEKTVKIVVSSLGNLKSKYGSKLSNIKKLLNSLKSFDKKRNIDTKIVYIDDLVSTKNIGVTCVTSITRQSCKRAIDEIYVKHYPEYMVIFGSQDIIPFQEIVNPVTDAEDSDFNVPSDLPYACESSYGTQINRFTGPTRIIGRIPDIPGKADIDYISDVVTNIISFKPFSIEKVFDYFAVTASVWKKSSKQNLTEIFGNNTSLKISPPQKANYSVAMLKPIVHFYNLHGSLLDPQFYGQSGETNFPVAVGSHNLINNIEKGTVVAAECCYGAQIFRDSDFGEGVLSVASTYLQNGAIAFLGSSTIAYGPSDTIGLADYMAQFFIKFILSGSSTGRALLEARQSFLTIMGPDLDAHELKTLAQFHLLGDPSLHLIAQIKPVENLMSVHNVRRNLFTKGVNLNSSTNPCVPVKKLKKFKVDQTKELKAILEITGFTGKEVEKQYMIKPSNIKSKSFTKSMTGSEGAMYRTFSQLERGVKDERQNIKVLVFKMSGNQLLGWKVYYSK